MQNLPEVAKAAPKTHSSSETATLQQSLQQLQNDHQLAISRNNDLHKHNSNLQEQANKLALLHKEEKEEKKSWIEKYDTLQTKYNKKVEQFAKEYYLLFGFCIMALVLLFLQILPTLQNQIANLLQ